MAFCKYCGKQLNEGQACDCPGSVAAAGSVQAAAPAPTPAPAPAPVPAPAPAPAPEVSPAQGTAQQTAGQQGTTQQASGQTTINITLPDKEKVTATAKTMWGSIMGILKKPATEGKAFVARADLNVTICLVVLQALCSALFSVFVIGKINGLLAFGGSFTKGFKFSGIKAFFLTLLFSVIFSALLMLFFWLAALITKVKTDWKQMLSLVAVRSVALLPLILISCILLLINPIVGFVVFYGANLLGMLYLAAAINGVPGFGENKAVYVVFVVSILFMAVSIWLGLKEAVLYVPGSVKDMMSGNILGLIEDLL